MGAGGGQKQDYTGTNYRTHSFAQWLHAMGGRSVTPHNHAEFYDWYTHGLSPVEALEARRVMQGAS